MIPRVKTQPGADALASQRTGLLWLALCSLSAGLYLWLARGVLLPIARRDSLEYVFVSASFGLLAASIAAACAFIVAVHLCVRLAAAKLSPQPPLFADEDVAYAKPLVGLAAGAFGLLSLVPGFAWVPPVWWYLIVDWRWAWTLLLLVWVLARVVARANLLGVILEARWATEAAIVALAVAWAVLGTPNLRFSGLTDGDEPKYIRYCENLYQGLGFEVTNLRPIAELPADYRSAWRRNIRLLGLTLPGELRSLAADAAAFAGEPSRRFNRAREVDVGFLVGKNGGVYQLYNPGVSILMFPAYYLDRRFGGVQPGSSAQWPSELRAVNAFFLVLYAFWTLLIYRFLRRLVPSVWQAGVATVALALTLPVAAFPFQFYPELAGGVLLFLVASHLLFDDRARAVVSFLHGLLAGYLPWLHIRFSAMASVLFLAAFVLRRHDRRRVISFAAGFTAPVALLCLYAYHLTGSVMPTAMWSAEGSAPVFSGAGAALTSVAYLLDRDWGLFAHSPIYLLALPGYVWLARRRPDVAWVSLLCFLALLIPAAGHTLHGAGTTPMRLIVAAVPLAGVPLAAFLTECGRRPTRQVAVALLLVVSLDNALAYNFHHYKGFGPMVDWSFSGWKVNLLFPAEGRAPWLVSPANAALAFTWLIALAALVAWPSSRRSPNGSLVTSIGSRPRLALAAVALLGLVGTCVSAATGDWVRNTYRIPAAAAATRTAARLNELGGCAICWTSAAGRVNAAALMAILSAAAPSR
jgi:hypothetical protein